MSSVNYQVNYSLGASALLVHMLAAFPAIAGWSLPMVLVSQSNQLGCSVHNLLRLELERWLGRDQEQEGCSCHQGY